MVSVMRFQRLKRLLYVVISAIALSPMALAPIGCAKAAKVSRHIDVTMKKYGIHPSDIRLKQGETVEFRVSTLDVQHGFDVPRLGIKESVQPRRPAVFSYTADQKGEFEVKCGILCGSGHERMRAKLVVE